MNEMNELAFIFLFICLSDWMSDWLPSHFGHSSESDATLNEAKILFLQKSNFNLDHEFLFQFSLNFDRRKDSILLQAIITST